MYQKQLRRINRKYPNHQLENLSPYSARILQEKKKSKSSVEKVSLDLPYPRERDDDAPSNYRSIEHFSLWSWGRENSRKLFPLQRNPPKPP
ncbi:hypothetical protein TNIN_311951 [Trichonephila inaurata madagascariensis]|uniref:Uncharacterized protein n=1 Tax=Trichonephila inaurata madagascariensis TaxID=2747483 RepID=A0A8X6MAY0_9ARAC|nr:hypothetical protein TNIN_311951 [Trichonephila inaurata madagascariensis]